jgi:hypothetical protein
MSLLEVTQPSIPPNIHITSLVQPSLATQAVLLSSCGQLEATGKRVEVGKVEKVGKDYELKPKEGKMRRVLGRDRRKVEINMVIRLK